MSARICKGMVVESSDGETLGEVIWCGARSFVAQRELFVRTSYTLHHADVVEAGPDSAVVRQTLHELEQTAHIVVGGKHDGDFSDAA